jgi:hypothetical protein
MSDASVVVMQALLEQHDLRMGLEPDSANETRVWHLLYSLIEYCDHHSLDLDLILENVRAEFNS